MRKFVLLTGLVLGIGFSSYADFIDFGNVIYDYEYDFAKSEADADYIEIEPDFPYINYIPLSYEDQKIIYDLWTQAGYSYSVALGIIDKETNGTFDKYAHNSNSNDYGLFQLNKKSWFSKFKSMYGINDMADMYDITLNTKGALYIYGDCVARYGNTEKALVAYNMGDAKYSSTKYSKDCYSRIMKWEAVLSSMN